jgi:hypothetical protein
MIERRSRRINPRRLADWANAEGNQLTDEQRAALRTLTTSPIAILTGAPGTGKTVTIKSLSAIMERAGYQVYLTAPTGRAAARLSEATGKPAQTLHRLLHNHRQQRPIRDLIIPPIKEAVIVDEASMLDLFLAQRLVEFCTSRTRLIFVGDVYQLPPVGPGQLFRDLIESRQIPVVELTNTIRQSEQSAVTAAARQIKTGVAPELPSPGEVKSDCYFIEANSGFKIQHFNEIANRGTSDALKEMGLIAMQFAGLNLVTEVVETETPDSNLESEPASDLPAEPDPENIQFFFEQEVETIKRMIGGRRKSARFVHDECAEWLNDLEESGASVEELDDAFAHAEAMDQYDEGGAVITMSSHERTLACGRVDLEFTAEDLPERARHLASQLRRDYANSVGIEEIWGEIDAEIEIIFPVSGKMENGARFYSHAGRAFTERDTADAPKVGIISQGCAERYWPGEDPLGRRIKAGGNWMTIVGVVGDVKQSGLDFAAAPHIYVPAWQTPWLRVGLLARTAAEPSSFVSAVRHQIQTVDSNQPFYNVHTMEELIDESVSLRRLNLLLLGAFAFIALALAAVGVYGVIAYAVTQRTQEIGIRMALGAHKRDVLKLVLRQGLLPTLAGVAVGLLAAFGLTRLMTKLLYEVSVTDPLTFIVVAFLLIAVALLACWIPARRATKVDPLTALRHD